MKKPHTLILALAISLTLSGCVVGAVADLAATTVVTAGKLAVKGTGAIISAAIPDGDDDDEDEKDRKKARKEKRTEQQVQQPTAPASQPIQPSHAPAYPSGSSLQPQPYPTPSVNAPRYITIDAHGHAHETVPPSQIMPHNPTEQAW